MSCGIQKLQSEYLTSWRITLFGPNIQLHGLEPLRNISLNALHCNVVQVLPNLSSLSSLEPNFDSSLCSKREDCELKATQQEHAFRPSQD